jgi:dTDP-4-dehydrorhamnose reductase
LRLATQREELRIVGDQIGAPTWSWAIAAATTNILTQIYGREDSHLSFSNAGGLYHMTAAGQNSWYEFTNAIMEEIQQCAPRSPWFAVATDQRPLVARRITSITTDQYPTSARRPSNSLLSNAPLPRTFRTQLPDLPTQFRDFFPASDG